MEEPTPWKLVWRLGREFVREWQPGAVAYVRFRHEGQRRTLAAGATDPGSAAQACAQTYAEALAPKPERRLTPGQEVVADLVSKWVAGAAGEPETVATLQGYGARFVEVFDGPGALAEIGKVRAYGRDRLRHVLLSTTKRELSGLRSFVRWCHEEARIGGKPIWSTEPVWLGMKSTAILPKKAAGVAAVVPWLRRSRLTPQNVAAVLAALPEVSADAGPWRFVVRARMEFAYETALRPATIDQIAWEDLAPTEDGVPGLRIRAAIDKSKYERTVTLLPGALAALGRAALPGSTREGLIFGRHDYRVHIDRARRAAGLSFHVAPYDFRHARATHWVDQNMPLSVVAFLLGHRLVTTSNRYVHPSGRAVMEWYEHRQKETSE